MKNPKRLTREQELCLIDHRVNPKDWLLVEETDFFLKLIHKKTGNKKSVDKFPVRKKGKT